MFPKIVENKELPHSYLKNRFTNIYSLHATGQTIKPPPNIIESIKQVFLHVSILECWQQPFFLVPVKIGGIWTQLEGSIWGDMGEGRILGRGRCLIWRYRIEHKHICLVTTPPPLSSFPQAPLDCHE